MAETDQATRNRRWREHVQSWQASGLTQIAYCQRHAFAYHQFGYWSRKLNERQAPVRPRIKYNVYFHSGTLSESARVRCFSR
jgi:hypothetical protein